MDESATLAVLLDKSLDRGCFSAISNNYANDCWPWLRPFPPVAASPSSAHSAEFAPPLPSLLPFPARPSPGSDALTHLLP